MEMTTHLEKSEPDAVRRTTSVLGLFRKIRFSFAQPLESVLSSEFCVPSSCGEPRHAL